MPSPIAIVPELTWSEGSFRPDLALVVEGDRIESVRGRGDLPVGIDTLGWAGIAALPGTVNAHGHAFQSLLKGFADDRPFESWRDDVLYPFSSRLSSDDIYAGAVFAFTEALLAGVTTTVDFFYLHDGANDNARRVIQAARDVGIRLVLARAFYDDDAPTAAPARYRESLDDAAARTLELARDVAGDPLVSVQPAPHSLHAASPETIAGALEVADELDVPCHLHLAEAAYEIEQVSERFGTTPVRLLKDRGLLGPRLVTIHSVWLDDEELDLLAASGAAVVHCPGANAFLGDGIARAPEMLRRGIRVALGPDGGCANNRQSVFDEMRIAGLVAKARLTDGGVLDAATALDMGTRAGGDVLGLPVGSLTAGSFADVVGLDLADLSLQPLATLDRQVVSSMQATAVTKVMVGGKLVVDGGRPQGIPAGDVATLVADATRGWSRP